MFFSKSIANKDRTEFLRYKLKMRTCSRNDRKQDSSGGGSSCSSSSNKIKVVDLQHSKVRTSRNVSKFMYFQDPGTVWFTFSRFKFGAPLLITFFQDAFHTVQTNYTTVHKFLQPCTCDCH